MAETTTIQIGKELADFLKRLMPGATYDQIIQQFVVREAVQGGQVATLPFSKSVAALTQDEEERVVPFDGIVSMVFMNFPPGPSQLVEVRVLYIKGGSKAPIVPSRDESFVALDDASPVFPNLAFPVQKDGRVRVEWYNYDSANAHTIPVLLMVTESPLARVR